MIDDHMPQRTSSLAEITGSACQSELTESKNICIPKPTIECQAETLDSGAPQRIPPAIDYLLRTFEMLRRNGIGATLRRLKAVTARLVHDGIGWSAQRATPPHAEEVLNLLPGEWVEVKSAEEIAATLDSTGRLNGLAFLTNMQAFCGKKFRVFKRMDRMYLEESRSLRRIKNTVLLDRVMCDGMLMKCDRSCLLYWREAWLRRVAPPEHGRDSLGNLASYAGAPSIVIISGTQSSSRS